MPRLMLTMKRMHSAYLFCSLLLMTFSLRINAMQSLPRLAIISYPAFVQAADLLSVELSQQTNVALLERSEIGKIIQEQKLVLDGISIKDSIKVGQILGADGVLTLRSTQMGTNAQVSASLIAVKQGVILSVINPPWPVTDVAEWGRLVSTHFQPFLPKLAVLPRDAVPISLLNLRAAVKTPKSMRLERELTELLLNRLTHERELFVLERRRLDKLVSEKELNRTEDSPFWNGSYLLDGIIDKNGYSSEQTTVSARLVPPGGVPVTIEVSGSRGKPGEIIEQLAIQIMQSLKKQSTVTDWKPTAEANQYFEETKWALKWGAIGEAQWAVESAWALGKRDMDCAILRLRANLPHIPIDLGKYSHGGLYLEGKASDQLLLNEELAELSSRRPQSYAWERRERFVRTSATFRKPDPEKIDQAIYLLEMYHDFSQTLPVSEPRINSEWYHVGIDVLNAASRVLRHFHFVTGSQAGVVQKLADLRAASRLVAGRICQAPSVQAAYFVGEQRKFRDDLHQLESNKSNIFSCKLESGALWQDRPEDCIAMYQELMGSPVFGYIHMDLLRRPLENPRISAWNNHDRGRTGRLWTDFLTELDNSTNYLHRIERKFIAYADARNDAELEETFVDLYQTIISNSQSIVSESVPLAFLDRWKNPVMGAPESDVISPAMSRMERRFKAEFAPQLAVIDGQYLAAAKNGNTRARFEKQSGTPGSSPALNPVKIVSAATGSENTGTMPVTTQALLLNQFIEIPLGTLTKEKILDFKIFARKFREGRLWLDLRFNEYGEGMNLPGFRAVIASCDLRTHSWQFIRYPQPVMSRGHMTPGFGGGELSNDCYFELFNGSLYLSQWGNIQRYDPNNRRWQRILVPQEKIAQLFFINEKLYAASDESIIEISGDDSSQILASCRRRPAIGKLDTLEAFGKVVLLPGPNKSLRACIGGSIFSWDGKEWTELFKVVANRPLDVTADGALLRLVTLGRSAEFRSLQNQSSEMELCWREESMGGVAQPRLNASRASDNTSKPKWNFSEGMLLAQAPATGDKSRLYFFRDHCAVGTVNHKIQLSEKDGRHAEIICFDPRSPQPLVVPLKFPLQNDTGQTNVIALLAMQNMTTQWPLWIMMTDDFMLIGRSHVQGFWAVSKSELESALTPQKK